MFLKDLSTTNSLPALSALMSFAGQRQQLIANNIANISTPDYRMKDVSTSQFRERLAEAVEDRRRKFDGVRGELDIRRSQELRQDSTGRLRLTPRETEGNVLFHDRNNRDLEGLMQDMVENAGVFRMATELIRSEMGLLRTAISERV